MTETYANLLGMRICEVTGCGLAHLAKGLCSAHYTQMKRGEELRPTKGSRSRRSDCRMPGCSESCFGVYCNAHVKFAYRIEKLYGLTVECYSDMLTEQNGLCAICNQGEPEHVDHCHETGRVRGLLCQACNWGLGYFRDDVKRMSAAIDYIERANG